MDSAWGSVLGSLVIALLGAAVAVRQAREAKRIAERSQSSTDRLAGYDQLQEDLRELREEVGRQAARREAQEQKDAREIRYQAGIIRALTDDVNDLRKLIADAGLPLPPRREWPPYPGEWREGSSS